MRMLRQFFFGFREGLKSFGENVSVIVNSFLLSMVYIFGAGITAVFARLVGKRFLDMDVSKGRDTYWADVRGGEKKLKNYYRQF